MCLFKPPEIKVPDVKPPAPPPPDLDSAPVVESIDFGGSAEVDTEDSTGISGNKSTGKSSLKIKRDDSANTKTGANLQLNQ